jgi:hypothetical protein
MEITKKIGSKQYGFKFTLLTLKKFCEYKSIELGEFNTFLKKNYIDSVNTLLRAAIDVGSEGKVLLSEYQVDDLIEQMTQDELTEILNACWQSMDGWVQKLGIKTKGEKKN